MHSCFRPLHRSDLVTSHYVGLFSCVGTFPSGFGSWPHSWQEMHRLRAYVTQLTHSKQHTSPKVGAACVSVRAGIYNNPSQLQHRTNNWGGGWSQQLFKAPKHHWAWQLNVSMLPPPPCPDKQILHFRVSSYSLAAPGRACHNIWVQCSLPAAKRYSIWSIDFLR